ncbi:AtpZ/AtpI family protein [Mucilaginibacter terrenus]|uniref:AtpZ/AtpI family protein n=1 Tax=Mucilaginibacter terrenus TaxID=2482727 RepID=A0A3E2NMX6_9SPHI|nr:AtpZ/AtpI family protein [Mucilaginibacter terrenus]RFZ82354.1 AtpZ/AtpI family protein [Mucilaginibacter terrenus]
MAKIEDDRATDASTQASSYAKYMGIAIQMIVIIGAFTFAGYKIDESTGHVTKWVTAVMSLAGVFISLYLVYRSTKS